MNKNKFSVIVIDDEKFAVANLCNLITEYCPCLKIIETAHFADEAILKINKLKPDVVFLDVNMPQQNGFDILEKINYSPKLVFVTAHENYALKALKVSAIDFLLKPIDINELMETEKKIVQIEANKSRLQNEKQSILNADSSSSNIQKISILGSKGYENIDFSDIIYLIGSNNYTLFHLINQKEIMVSKTLKEYEEMLFNFGFFRIHKSNIINIAHVEKIVQIDGVEVLMTDGKLLNVSRRRTTDLLDLINKK